MQQLKLSKRQQRPQIQEEDSNTKRNCIKIHPKIEFYGRFETLLVMKHRVMKAQDLPGTLPKEMARLTYLEEM
ncbi:unnamed protein product [Prunus armeniaca]